MNQADIGVLWERLTALSLEQRNLVLIKLFSNAEAIKKYGSSNEKYAEELLNDIDQAVKNEEKANLCQQISN